VDEEKRVFLKSLAILLGCTLLLYLAVSNAERIVPERGTELRPDPTIEAVQSRIRVGDARSNAVQALPDAWFHTECRSGAVVEDLFFLGPRDRNKARIVLVSSEVTDGETVVHFVGGIEYAMLGLFEHCVPPPQEAFGNADSGP